MQSLGWLTIGMRSSGSEPQPIQMWENDTPLCRTVSCFIASQMNGNGIRHTFHIRRPTSNLIIRRLNPVRAEGLRRETSRLRCSAHRVANSMSGRGSDPLRADVGLTPSRTWSVLRPKVYLRILIGECPD